MTTAPAGAPAPGTPNSDPTAAPTAPGSTEPLAAPPAAPAAPPGPTAEQLADAQRQATEAAEQRDQLQAALDAINKAINPDAAGADSDPAQLAAAVAERDRQLADLGAQLRTARVEVAAHQAAEAAGARPDRLLNSRSFAAAVADLDPTDPKFGELLTAAITAAVDADPDLYRAAGAPPARSGGGEFRGAPTTRTEPASLLEAISARLAK
ncbi:hypothetical protein [Kitasatospora sp. NPDC047058]|uniref:hypothetical protein n=1 Tax=Kitasatospora sp. NPDC047058 TaxID=3155620 RepID=UPI0033FEE79C